MSELNKCTYIRNPKVTREEIKRIIIGYFKGGYINPVLKDNVIGRDQVWNKEDIKKFNNTNIPFEQTSHIG